MQLLGHQDWDGVVCVEVGTRKVKYAGAREEWLVRSLEFARRHLAIGWQQRVEATDAAPGEDH